MRRARPSQPATQSAGDPRDAFWSLPEEKLWQTLGSSRTGLTTTAAAERLSSVGPNTLRASGQRSDVQLLLRQVANPIVLLLIAATLVSLLLGDLVDASIILVIVFASGLLGFWQERDASRAVAALLARVAVVVDVRRDNRTVSVPIGQIVPGDVVLLNAGDVVPGDGRVVAATALLVDEAALTGESYPAEKGPAVLPAETPLPRRTNAVFMGSHVVSGSGEAVIVRTGSATELGQVAGALGAGAAATGFERGIARFGYLLVRATLVLVATIFAVNFILQRPAVESLLFSLALAVGLTPQLLPAIVSISLSTGARQMAREQVIVKRLDAIEDFGAMTVLCTDKTGTITAGTVTLVAAPDADGTPSETVARLAWLNARYQTGYSNPLDQAILQSRTFDTTGVEPLSEAPYDFTRKRLSVLVRDAGKTVMIAKGALQPILAVCTRVATPTGAVPLDARRAELETRFERLSGEGWRVLGVATRELSTTSCSASDEQGMTFAGFLTFADPPKADAAAAIAELAGLGISVRMITGDNRLAATHAAAAVGLDATSVLTGEALKALSDRQLIGAARDAAVFAEIEPAQKERLIVALQAEGRVVGFLGCTRPTSGSRSTRRSTWPSRPPPSCSSTRTSPSWPMAFVSAARRSPTP
jgi:Mg2+-importing ATPase